MVSRILFRNMKVLFEWEVNAQGRVSLHSALKLYCPAQGSAMAERLYRDAVQRGRIPEDVRIPLASLSQEAGESHACL